MSLAALVVLALAAAFLWAAGRSVAEPVAAPATAAAASNAQAVREDSYVLGAPGTSGVTLVEFLDFECEGCRAAYPLVEQLRRDYDGSVTFVVRYFPLAGHLNAMNAALAVEAAAQQGSFEDMYARMYATQASWGDQQVSHADTFRGFAENLGLDLAAYDRAIAEPASRARVEKDVADGLGLGVQGTPTFFLNERQLQPTSEEDLRASIDAALAAAPVS
jgi:protein-disulfide isomerase